MPINYQEQTYCAGVLSVRVDAGAAGEATTYSVLDSEGRVVATGIDCLGRASLFAHAAPLLSYLAGAMEELGRKPQIVDWVESWTNNSNKCLALFKP